MANVIALKRLHGTMYIECDDSTIHLHLPEGCTGVLLCFNSKKTAMEYWGRNVRMMQFDVDEQEEP